MKYISWFSAGAASAVATKLAIKKYGDQLSIVYIDTGSEHEDNIRFLRDCERWYGKDIEIIRSQEYKSTWDLWEQSDFIVSVHGAKCSSVLKKRVRQQYEGPDDVHIFGYTFEEKLRAKRFARNNFELKLEFTLIDAKLTKQDCLAMVNAVGIDLPVMYKLGYSHNNCIGCVKGGAGYWNKIRIDFPEIFERMAKLERQKGFALIANKIDGKFIRTFLDELDPAEGLAEADYVLECSPLCRSHV